MRLVLIILLIFVATECYADIGWYICPYKRRPGRIPTRYCAMDDYTNQIFSEGGGWSETEVLGDRAIVKVKASTSTLTTLNTIFKRLPKTILDSSLSDLTSQQKNTIKNELLDMGYTLTEIQNRFGNNLGDYTFRDVLNFMATRRLKPRYDIATDMIICDGEIQPVKPIENVEKEVN